MNALATRYAEQAFALAVTGAALVWPPLALLVAAAFLVGFAVLQYRAGGEQ